MSSMDKSIDMTSTNNDPKKSSKKWFSFKKEERKQEEAPTIPNLRRIKMSRYDVMTPTSNGNDHQRTCGSCDISAEPWGCVSWFEYTLVVSLSLILLLGCLALTIFWIMYYRGGMAWGDADPLKTFNFHPVFMVAGSITFSGFGILVYRICRCCKRLYVKLIHAVFQALSVPCIVFGFYAALEYHRISVPQLPDFYSMHSWIGLITVGLFALQFLVGFFSFLLLLCCNEATADFRARMVPIHASFGLITFAMSIATCLTGLTQKAYLTLGDLYSTWLEEGIVMNALAVTLVAILLVVVFSVRRYNRQRCPRVSVDPSSS